MKAIVLTLTLDLLVLSGLVLGDYLSTREREQQGRQVTLIYKRQDERTGMAVFAPLTPVEIGAHWDSGKRTAAIGRGDVLKCYVGERETKYELKDGGNVTARETILYCDDRTMVVGGIAWQ